MAVGVGVLFCGRFAFPLGVLAYSDRRILVVFFQKRLPIVLFSSRTTVYDETAYPFYFPFVYRDCVESAFESCFSYFPEVFSFPSGPGLCLTFHFLSSLWAGCVLLIVFLAGAAFSVFSALSPSLDFMLSATFIFFSYGGVELARWSNSGPNSLRECNGHP